MYLYIENNSAPEFGFSADDIRARFPDTSFPGDAESFDLCVSRRGFLRYQPAPQPVADHEHNVVEATPELINDQWTQRWALEPATAQQIAERTEAKIGAVKAERNRLLLDSDWTQLPDAPADRATWGEYREALRQVKYQPGYPWAVEWPVRPDAALIRARDAEGQYVGDDPLTPVRESLVWVEVSDAAAE